MRNQHEEKDLGRTKETQEQEMLWTRVVTVNFSLLNHNRNEVQWLEQEARPA